MYPCDFFPTSFSYSLNLHVQSTEYECLMTSIGKDPRISEAEKERFLALLEPVHNNLARFARSVVPDDEEARDLVGDTVLKALEHFDELNDEKAFLSWLFTIAVRLGRQWRKQKKRFGLYDENEVARRPSMGASPEVRHDVSALYNAIEKLRDGEREAILLFEIAGLSLEEVRKVQGGSLSGVKSRLARGRKKLEKILGIDKEEQKDEKEERVMAGQEIESTRFIYSTLPRQ